MRLAEIEPQHVKAYAAEVAATDVSRNAVRLALAPVRVLFATAVEEGVLRRNPAAGVRLPAGKQPLVLRSYGELSAAEHEVIAAVVRALGEPSGNAGQQKKPEPSRNEPHAGRPEERS